MKKYGLIIGVIILIFAMSSCSKRSTTGAGDDLSQRVNLTMWVLGDPAPKHDEVMENLNKLLIEKINATLKVNYLSWGDFGAGMYPLLFSSGEDLDMVYTATWLNWSELARRGAFKDLTELWPKYAPKNFARQSQTALYQATVNGRLFCIPTLMATYSAYGLIFRTDLNLPGWDGKMENFVDIERYLAAVKANNPQFEPLDVAFEGSQMDDLFMFYNKMYAVKGATNDFLFIDPFQSNPKLFTYYEYAKTPEFLDMMDRWNRAGYFSKSALSDSESSKLSNGIAASTIHNIDTYEGQFRDYPERKMRWLNLVTDVSNLSFTQDALAIAQTSKNPERALMLWDLITNDEQVYRAFYYGIEGKSYTISREGGREIITPINTTDYYFSNCWASRTNEFHLPTAGAPPDLAAHKASYDAHITDGVGAQKFRSFVLDTSSVETEYATLNNVHRQYLWPLELGFVDVRTGLREYQQRMEAAGIERVREVLQSQLDAYLREIAK